MDAGTLNRRVTLQALLVAVDELGQPVQTWSDVETVWGNVRFLNGVETLKSGAVMATTKASIRIRPRVVTTAMRAVVGVTEFNIINVLPDEQNKDFIDLACEVFT